MTYVEKELASGFKVGIRARSYSEWEEQEEARLKSVEALPGLVKEGKVQEVEIALQRANLEVRNARLEAWVDDFDGLKHMLSLRDVAEIEKAALELEQEDIPLGNSATGGDGQ